MRHHCPKCGDELRRFTMGATDTRGHCLDTCGWNGPVDMSANARRVKRQLTDMEINALGRGRLELAYCFENVPVTSKLLELCYGHLRKHGIAWK